MTSAAIIALVQKQFGPAIIQAFADDLHPRFHANAENWREIAQFLLRDPQLQLNWLACLSGVDYAADAKFCVVYDLWSFEHRHSIAVKIFTPRQQPSIPSVADLWSIADWHEREVYDMFGVDFPGHPDLRCAFCWRMIGKDFRCARIMYSHANIKAFPAVSSWTGNRSLTTQPDLSGNNLATRTCNYLMRVWIL